MQENIQKWLKYRQEAFEQEGYPSVSCEDLSRYLYSYLWKHNEPSSLFEKFYTINHILPNEYFDFERLEAQVKKVTPLDEMDFSSLF